MTDTEIINLFFERSEQAITELAKKHGSAVARVARNILGNEQDAEECVNDTYLGAWNAIPPHKPNPLRTFVCKIARNLATMKYHSNTAEKRNSHYDVALDELEECLSESDTVEEEYDAKELSQAIKTRDLPQDQQPELRADGGNAPDVAAERASAGQERLRT